jgi:hypothetical protein
MRKTPMNRATPGAIAWAKKPRKPVNAVSKAGRQQRALWVSERDAHLESQPDCQGPAAGLEGRCSAILDVQHKQGRGAGGRRGSAGPLVTLCRKHHDWITEHPAEGRALGLVESMKGKR